MRIVLAIVALLALGCGPQLVVRHLDGSAPIAKVFVDGAFRGTVKLGEELKVDLDRGLRSVKVTRVGQSANAWADDGRAWEVVVEDDVFLTLLPRPSARR